MKSTYVMKFGVAALTVFATLSLHAASAAGSSVLFATYVPAVPEPSTYVAGALMLIPLGAGIARAYYKNRKK